MWIIGSAETHYLDIHDRRTLKALHPIRSAHGAKFRIAESDPRPIFDPSQTLVHHHLQSIPSQVEELILQRTFKRVLH